MNSTALSGIAVIKGGHDQPIKEKELNIKHGNNMKSVNITDLPTGNYKASVYDSIEDNQPAYQHPEFLNIVAHSPTPTPSTTVVHTGATDVALCNAVFIIRISLLETAIVESSLVRGTVHNSSSPGPTMTMTITQSMLIILSCDNITFFHFFSVYR